MANEVANAIPSRTAAFATMNWYEALYYGLDVAQLQNAAGEYVAPSATSVDAALADASVNTSDGVLTNNYTGSGDSAAYPTPVVIYAVVPTGLPASTAGAVGTELRAMLAVTAGGDGAAVPPGLLPLPAKLASEATATVSSVFPAPPAPAPGASTPSSATTVAGPGSTPSPASPPGSTGSGVTGETTATTSGPGATFDGSGPAARNSAHAGPAGAKAPLSTGDQKAVKADFLGLVPPGGRWLLIIVLLAAGAAAILIGPAVLGLLRARRRPTPDGGPEAPGAPDPTGAG